MNILFYTQFDSRSRDTESLMLAFINQGHSVYFLSQTESQEYVSFLNKIGVKASFRVFQKSLRFLNHLFYIFYLISYCRKNKINVLYSHLEYANFIAVLSQYFIKSKVLVCRHHVDEIHLIGKNKSISYYLIYKLAKKIIVVSERAKQFMIKEEKIDKTKIYKVNLAYDFSLYNKIDYNNVDKIKHEHGCDLLIISACRLVKDKRPELGLELIERLREQRINAKLLILGKGEMFDWLNAQIETRGLSKNCFLLGHKPNVLDYLAASDIVFHPSNLDSSSVVIKEAGLAKKPVIVCTGVGDFEDYIKHLVNGILVRKENTVEDTMKFLCLYNQDKNKYTFLGENLYMEVKRLFSIENVLPEYEKFNS